VRSYFIIRAYIVPVDKMLTGYAELEAETGYTKGELWIVDLGDFASVKHFGERFEKDGGRLDILIANAGISTEKYEATKDGWESTLVTFPIRVSVILSFTDLQSTG
jgi:NAD(P)-dependent dehydrogenase (short-subunit alcohol dehydrogenase family)